VLRAWLVSLRGLGLWLTGLMGYQKNPQKAVIAPPDTNRTRATRVLAISGISHQPSGISHQTPIDASL
jgi:hypothetical protein